jgi:hypothetical protein
MLSTGTPSGWPLDRHAERLAQQACIDEERPGTIGLGRTRESRLIGRGGVAAALPLRARRGSKCLRRADTEAQSQPAAQKPGQLSLG